MFFTLFLYGCTVLVGLLVMNGYFDFIFLNKQKVCYLGAQPVYLFLKLLYNRTELLLMIQSEENIS